MLYISYFLSVLFGFVCLSVYLGLSLFSLSVCLSFSSSVCFPEKGGKEMLYISSFLSVLSGFICLLKLEFVVLLICLPLISVFRLFFNKQASARGRNAASLLSYRVALLCLFVFVYVSVCCSVYVCLSSLFSVCCP